MAEAETEQLELDTGSEDEEPEAKSTESVSVEDFKTLQEQREADRLEMAELRGQLKVAANTPAPAAPDKEVRDLTRDELQGMVDSGQLTEGQRDDRLEAQSDRRLEKKLDARDATNRGQVMLEEEFAKYREGHPGIEQVGHADHTLLQAEYSKLLAGGFPHNQQTQITALRGVFGSAERIPERRRVSDTTREGGASGEEAASGLAGGDRAWTKDLSARHVHYVDRMVDRGIFSPADVKDYASRARGSAGAGTARVQ